MLSGVLRRLRRVLAPSTEGNRLAAVIHETVPDPTEAECDRYLRSHLPPTRP